MKKGLTGHVLQTVFSILSQGNDLLLKYSFKRRQSVNYANKRSVLTFTNWHYSQTQGNSLIIVKTQNNKTLLKQGSISKKFNLIKSVNFRDNQDLKQDERAISRALRTNRDYRDKRGPTGPFQSCVYFLIHTRGCRASLVTQQLSNWNHHLF